MTRTPPEYGAEKTNGTVALTRLGPLITRTGNSGSQVSIGFPFEFPLIGFEIHSRRTRAQEWSLIQHHLPLPTYVERSLPVQAICPLFRCAEHSSPSDQSRPARTGTRTSAGRRGSVVAAASISQKHRRLVARLKIGSGRWLTPVVIDRIRRGRHDRADANGPCRGCATAVSF